MTGTPIQDLEQMIRELVEGALFRTGWKQEELSENLGYNSQYIAGAKHHRTLHKMRAESLATLARLAGKKLTIETGR